MKKDLKIGIGKRTLLLVICMLYFNSSYSQNKKGRTFPFKIVYAENVFKKGNIPVNSNEPLRLTDTITLNSGLVILSYRSGGLFEFEGDTSLVLESIVPTDPLAHHEIVDYSILWEREYEKQNNLTGAGNICFPSLITFIYPPRNSYHYTKEEGICLMWDFYHLTSDKIKYKIELRNMFDELIWSNSVNDQMISIDFSEFSNHDYKLLVAKIIVGEEESQIIGLRPIENYKLINPCNAKTSIELLQLAILFEINQKYESANIYYERASKQSTQKAYSIFLANYRARAKSYLY